MPPIYIMAAVTLVIAIALWGGLIYLFSGYERRYFWLLLMGLPLSALVNLYIKPQAVIVVGQAFHVPPGLGLMAPAWFLAFRVVVTPLIEEAVKVIPLLWRPARRMVSGQPSAFWVGFVLGVSFGLGEAIFIAYAVAHSAQYASLPWYAFTGYLNERLMACFAHGVLTAILLTALQRGRGAVVFGYGSALALHLFLNLPVVLYQFRWISVELEGFLMVIPFITLAVVFERIRRGLREPGRQAVSDGILYLRR